MIKKEIFFRFIILILFFTLNIQENSFKLLAQNGGNFGVDAFGSYAGGFTPPGTVSTYFKWEAEKVANAGITWNRTLSPAGGQFSWNRIEAVQGVYDWGVADTLVKACQTRKIQLLALVKPYTPWDQPGKNDREYGKPNNMTAFRNFLKAMIERYDGDGINDMPGLASGYAIKYWEIDNEPEFGKYGGIGAGSQQYQDYYTTLKNAYEAIKSADSTAKVLNAGMSPIYHPVTGFFEFVVRNFWDSVLTNLGGKDYCDILNVHYTIPEPARYIKDFVDQWKRYNKDMWLTETGTYSGTFTKDSVTYPYRSEEFQASWWIKHCSYGFANRVNKIFWATFFHGQFTPDWFANTCMVKSDSTTKLIYTTQKVMASKIDDFTSVTALTDSQYKFIVNGNSVYVLWGNNPPPGEITGNIKVTNIYGNSQIIPASSLTLSYIPVFVELMTSQLNSPNLFYPVNSSWVTSPTLIFKWYKVTDASSYHFQLSSDSSFVSIIVNDSLLVDTSKQITGLLHDTKYYWRVKAKNATTISNWSNVWNFNTLPIPNKVRLIQPPNNSTVSSDTVTFRWWYNFNPPFLEVSKFWLEYSIDSTMINAVIDSTLGFISFTKRVTGLLDNQDYWWRVRAGNDFGWGEFSDIWKFKFVLTDVESGIKLPKEFALYQNYPNPFNPSTTIKFSILPACLMQYDWAGRHFAFVTLKVYDVLGREVVTLVNEEKSAGRHSVEWNAKNSPSGVYFYELKAENFRVTKKMIISK